MIVHDDDVSAALQYLSVDPHPKALAIKDLMVAENARKAAYAEAFLKAEGSVEARKAEAELDQTHQKALRIEAEETFELERHKSRVTAADKLLSIFQTEHANARAAERIR
jgi:DNA topoisomerase VI subunit B